MRVTNNMIMNNAASNINSTKELVNKRNTQMTSQKKISKPSEDPVIAVRSLRLSATLSVVNQYYQKNIPDASSWLDVTETALTNMRSIVADCRELAVTGSTDTYSETDRNTMLDQLEALQKQLYAEGNASYAGRTVFTGYRTDRNLTFTENEGTTAYEIAQTIKVSEKLEENRYYTGNVTIPTNKDELGTKEVGDISESIYRRIKLAYNSVEIMSTDSVAAAEDMTTMFGEYGTLFKDGYDTYNANKVDDGNGKITIGVPPVSIVVKPAEEGSAPYTIAPRVYDDEEDWADVRYVKAGVTQAQLEDATIPDSDKYESRGKYVGDNEVVIIESTGEMIFGKNIASQLMKEDASISIAYTRTGFTEGELRPEYYYNCIKTEDVSEESTPIVYTKYDNGKVINFDIQYTIAAGQTININSEASNIFDSSLQRDLDQMIDAVATTISAHDKIDKLKGMMQEAQYASTEDQAKLQEWLEAAQKEADYADDNMQKLFNSELGKIDTYYAKINLALTDLGCKTDSINLTKTRVGDQQETVQDLQSKNDDIDLSQIIIDYTAAYTAYQASLQAAGKLSQSTLLNYI